MRTILRPPLQARVNSGITFRPDANTVLWLPGQDDPQSSTIRDRSGNSNDGAITGALWKQTGQGLWYLDFDGTDDNVNLGTDASMDLTNFTIAVWAKLSVLPSDSGPENMWLFGKAQAFNVNGYQLWLRATDRIDVATSQAAASQESTSAGSVLTADTWLHIAGTVSGAVGKVYLGGDDVTSFSATHIAPTPASKTATIGLQGTIFDLNGGLALLRVYSKALSAGEIKGIFNTEIHLFGV
ncbi:hypothetical protein LCGC14_2658680 [marine sediment metagenome]|uniref:LamG-like jellyroll fold domain-containing protein n=1 Tax=marine sediment metagenome TaxID=412755 RepID=A0A0F9CJI1_9ZZZZ